MNRILPLSSFRSRLIAASVFSLLAALIAVYVVPMNSHASTQSDDMKVLIVSLPRVTWKQLRAATSPNLDHIVDQGSVAAMSVRALRHTTTPAEGYATVSAGNRATASGSQSATFLKPTEIINGDIASSLYRDERGNPSFKNPAALGVGFEQTQRANSRGMYDTEVGAFAEALDKDKKSIAVFGNTDTCLSDDPNCFSRAISFMGTDTQGVVRYGDISRNLLNSATPEETTQLSLDMRQLAHKASASVKRHDVTVVECSDIERIELARTRSENTISDKNYMEAIEKCDMMIGKVMKSIDLDKDQIYIFSPSAPRSQSQTAIFAAAGKGIPRGYASSATTRREGVVTLVDIAPTILTDMNVALPKSMGKTLLDWRANTISSGDRQDFLVQMNNQAIIRDKAIAPATMLLVVLVVVSVLISMVAYSRAKSWKSTAQYVSLMAACIPTIGFLIKPLMETLETSMRIVLTMAFISAVLAAGLLYCGKRWGFVPVILGIAVTNLAVQFLDILTGGNLQFNTVFGYSPVVAGRFAGYGNQAFAIVAISAVITVAMVKEISKQRSWNEKKVNIGLLAFLVFVLIVDGAPYWGSDVGGVLALTPTIFVIGMMLYNKRVGIKSLLIASVVTVGTITVFAFVDLARPAEQRTHLGRFAESLMNGQAGIIIERKIAANLRILTASVWAVIVIVSLLYLMFLFFHPERFLRKTSEVHPGFLYLAYPGIVVGLLGMALNDSGVAIPGMMMAIAIPAVTLLALGITEPGPKADVPKLGSSQKKEKV